VKTLSTIFDIDTPTANTTHYPTATYSIANNVKIFSEPSQGLGSMMPKVNTGELQSEPLDAFGMSLERENSGNLMQGNIEHHLMPVRNGNSGSIPSNSEGPDFRTEEREGPKETKAMPPFASFPIALV
jgi:hypothetical protein